MLFLLGVFFKHHELASQTNTRNIPVMYSVFHIRMRINSIARHNQGEWWENGCHLPVCTLCWWFIETSRQAHATDLDRPSFLSRAGHCDAALWCRKFQAVQKNKTRSWFKRMKPTFAVIHRMGVYNDLYTINGHLSLFLQCFSKIYPPSRGGSLFFIPR